MAGAVAAIDVGLVAAAGIVAYKTYFGVTGSAPEPARYVMTALLAATMFVAMFERSGGYRVKRLILLRWQLTHVLMIWAVTVGLLLLLAFVGKISQTYSRGWMLVWTVTAASLLPTGRGVLHLALSRWLPPGCLARKIAILGAGSEGRRLIAKLENSPDPGFTICGVYDDRGSRLPAPGSGRTALGTTDDLIHRARRGQVDEVIVALPLDDGGRITAVIDRLQELPVDLRLSVEPIARMFTIRGMIYIGQAPVLEISDRPLKNWRGLVKWIEDKVLSLLMLFWLAPLMAVIAVLIKLDSGGPVFFIQERFGFNNNVIRVFKFRTMHVDRGDPSGAQQTVRDDPRVTRVGRVLRWLSLDELPQLINVLRGDMSLVGPRPHPIAMKAGDRLFGDAVEQYFHRHRVKPGITGWAQVNGLRGEVDTVDKAQARVEHDLYYIEHWSPWIDLKILLMTMRILGSRDTAY